MRINRVSSISKATSVDATQHRKPDQVLENNKQRLHYLNSRDGLDSRQSQMNVLTEAVEDINDVLEGYNRRFEISIHEGTNAVMVKVIDEVTEEVIREIPPEKILDMVAVLWEMAGIIIDKKI